jgi:two-component system, cell cycle response regulator
MRVLVVDDEESVRTMLEMVLGFEDLDVTVASDGQEALTLARFEPPDVIVLDIMMPRMDGWTFADEARNDPALAQIPIVFCSAMTGEGHREAARQRGGEYVTKPFHTDDLVTAVLRAAGQPPLATR